MNTADRGFDIYGALGSDVVALRDAVSRGRLFHASKDIDTAGDEVESVVRELIQSHLPLAYGVGQGHIVDANRAISSQFDVIIYDALSTVKLATAKDGTAWYPYHTVFAVGEVRMTYDRSRRPFEDFAKKIATLDNLSREDQGLVLASAGFMPVGNDDAPRRKMLSFDLFASGEWADSDSVSLDAIPQRLRPGFSCLPDSGTVLSMKPGPVPKSSQFELFPGLSDDALKTTLISHNNLPVSLRPAATLAFLYWTIADHLAQSGHVLLNPDDYFPFRHGPKVETLLRSKDQGNLPRALAIAATCMARIRNRTR